MDVRRDGLNGDAETRRHPPVDGQLDGGDVSNRDGEAEPGEGRCLLAPATAQHEHGTDLGPGQPAELVDPAA